MKSKLMITILSVLLVFSLVLVTKTNYQKPKLNDFYANNSEESEAQEDTLKENYESIESNKQDIPSVPESNLSEKLENQETKDKKNNNSKNPNDSKVSNKSKSELNKPNSSNQNKSTTNKANDSVQDNNQSKNNANNNPTDDSKKNKNMSKDEVVSKIEVCSTENPNFVRYLNSWKAQNQYSLVFYSKEKLESYITKATRVYGYGAWKSSIPIVYKDNDCSISFYSAMLYIPKTNCIDSNGKNNEKMYIKATLEKDLINKYQYLTNLGYICEGKTW